MDFHQINIPHLNPAPAASQQPATSAQTAAPAQTVAVQRPVTVQQINPAPAGPLSQPVFVMGGVDSFPSMLLFHDNQTLWAYNADGSGRAWYIKAHATIAGFVLSTDNANLYVQDGDVLCQYDLAAVQTSGDDYSPINAISFRPATPRKWSVSVQGAGNFGDLFNLAFPSGQSALTYSAPMMSTNNVDDIRVRVLRSDGCVFSPLYNLDPPYGSAGTPESHFINATNLVPDETVLYRVMAGNQQQFRWISKGKIACLESVATEPAPPEGIDAWRWNCILASTDQPWQPFGSAGAANGFISRVAANGGHTTAIVLHDAQGTCSFHLLDSSWLPQFNAARSMMVRDGDTGGAVDHANPGLPAGLVVAPPPPGAHEHMCVLAAAKDGPLKVLAAPRLMDPSNGNFFAIVQADSQYCLYQYRVPDVSDVFIMCWWKGAKDAFTTAQPILAREIVYALDDATQAAGSALPGNFSQSTYSSPLWAARFAVPWSAFPNAPTYVRCSKLGFATQINTAYGFDNSMQSRLHAAYMPSPKPSKPLWGPHQFSFGNTTYVVLSNRYGIYGFKPDGTLAWQIPAYTAFQGWVTVNQFLFLSQSYFLCRYDVSKFPNNGAAVLYPDAYVDLDYKNAFKIDGPPAQNAFLSTTVRTYYDNVVPTSMQPVFAGHTLANYAVPYYDGAHTLFINRNLPGAFGRPPVPYETMAVSMDVDLATGDFLLKTVKFSDARNVHLGGAMSVHDLTDDPTPIAWQPGPLSFQVNRPLANFHVEQPITKAIGINASDGVPVQISGIPCVGAGAQTYCCLVKQGQYFFAGIRA